MPWTANLSRPLMLVDGTKLVTFKDAIESLVRNFVGTEPDAIEPAIGLLVKADTTRNNVDINEASRQFESVLRARQLVR